MVTAGIAVALAIAGVMLLLVAALIAATRTSIVDPIVDGHDEEEKIARLRRLNGPGHYGGCDADAGDECTCGAAERWPGAFSARETRAF